jgi:quinol monooxygenase YgiN
MSEIVYIVKMTAAEGRRDEALAVLGKLVASTEDEPGTLQYAMHADGADGDVIWFYERYEDKAAFDAHLSSAAMAEAIGSLGGMLAGAPELRQVEVTHRKGGL